MACVKLFGAKPLLWSGEIHSSRAHTENDNCGVPKLAEKRRDGSAIIHGRNQELWTRRR
jgi:hypothetical protein